MNSPPSLKIQKTTKKIVFASRFLRGGRYNEVLDFQEDSIQDHSHFLTDKGHSHVYTDTHHKRQNVNGYWGLMGVLYDQIM